MNFTISVVLLRLMLDVNPYLTLMRDRVFIHLWLLSDCTLVSGAAIIDGQRPACRDKSVEFTDRP